MFAEERKRIILAALKHSGKATIIALADKLSVSEDTIRRDLQELSDGGLLRKVRGGALSISTVPYDYSARVEHNVDNKRRLARKAAALIKDGDCVFIDGGTTTGLISQYLPPEIRATVITYSPANAISFSRHEHIEVIMLGGKLLKDILTVHSPAIFNEIAKFRADTAFCSVHGLTAEHGATVRNYEDSLVKMAIIAQSAENVVLAGADKVGYTAPFNVIDASAIDTLITDVSSLPGRFAELGCSVVHV